MDTAKKSNYDYLKGKTIRMTPLSGNGDTMSNCFIAQIEEGKGITIVGDFSNKARGISEKETKIFCLRKDQCNFQAKWDYLIPVLEKGELDCKDFNSKVRSEFGGGGSSFIICAFE